MKKHSLLFVDDEPDILDTLRRTFYEEHDVHCATNGEEGLEIMAREPISLVMTDQRMPGMTGVDLLRRTVEKYPHVMRLLITGFADLVAVIDAVNAGHIYGYISKPWEPHDLQMHIQHALAAFEMAQENARLTEELNLANEKLRQENLYWRKEARGKYAFDQIIGESPAMKQIFQRLEKVVGSPTTVLITGETGTGKEVVARAIHYNSTRKDRKFVAQNCAALSESLLESELFGHKKGAYTGAVADNKGLFELAHGGTIFLDEIGETSSALQTKLLRVLEEKEIRPIGAIEQKKIDVRLVAATNRDLPAEVKAGRFREDLFFRINVFTIDLPPLRERRPDIPALAYHFLERCNKRLNKRLVGFTSEVMSLLNRYAYPGNVRELFNIVESASVMAEHDHIEVGDLPEHLRVGRMSALIDVPIVEKYDDLKTLKQTLLEDADRKFIEYALKRWGGRVTEIARETGINRSLFHQMAARYGFNIGQFKTKPG